MITSTGKTRRFMSTKKSCQGDWILSRNVKPSAKVRLFCLPYAGGGASLFCKWQQQFPADIDVCPIELPGRESRFKEAPIGNMDRLMDALEEGISDRLYDLPVAFYGHSMGALIAYNFSLRLMKHSRVDIAHLFAGAHSAPVIWPNPIFQKLENHFKKAGYEFVPDCDFIKKMSVEKVADLIHVFSAIPQFGNNLQLDQEFLLKMLPIILSDMELVGGYKYNGNDTFNLSITAFHGKFDKMISVDDVKAWKQVTGGQFECHVLPGDHLFINQENSLKKLIELINDSLGNYPDVRGYDRSDTDNNG
jgi:surfactin synthase thioesterase subunit